MAHCLPDSPIISKFFQIFIQVIFIFIFLTIFFFTYVQEVEKNSFKLQMNLVVDDMASDLNIKSLIPYNKKDIVQIVINGSLDVAKTNSIKKSKNEDQNIEDNNTHIKTQAYKWLGISIGIMLLSILFIYMLGYCIPIQIHGKEALIVVFFVAFTEFIFLTVITKKYWSVDPGQIRQHIGKSIQKYIKNKQLI